MMPRLLLALGLLLFPAQGLLAATDYQIGAGDLLRVTVFDHPELGGEVRVSQSGAITLAPVGEVAVAGLSARELEQQLGTVLESRDIVRRGQVQVHVLEYQSQRVSVMGQVARPGQYPLTGQRNVLDMLAAAGGTLIETAADEATLVRADGSRVPLDLRRLFDGDPASIVVVRHGDTLFVPRAPVFYIYGEVQRPGAYRLERGMSLSQAIAAGGGLTPRGTERGVSVRRKDGRGAEKVLKGKAIGQLLDGDVVRIKERLF